MSTRITIKSFWLLGLLFSLNTFASPKVVISDVDDWITPVQEQKLEREILRAAKFYHTNMNFFVPEVNVVIAGSKCFRTGYSYKDATFRFCQGKKKKVINFGLDSIDVINHEVFHYFFCHQYPDKCVASVIDDKTKVLIHEGLADFFAYKMNPDQYFGENYKAGAAYLRPYENDFCFNMVVRSPHLKGSAITGYLIRNNLNFNDLKTLFTTFDLADLSNDSCFQPRTEPILTVVGRSPSKLHKYWMKKNETIEFESSLVGQYDYALFAPPKKFKMSVTNNVIKFTSHDESGIEPVFLLISQNGKTVGVIKMIIGVRKN